MYTAYALTQETREKLVASFPPKYSKWIGHHITVKFGISHDTAPPTDATIVVIGYVDSEDGIEALVVQVDGDITRPDGKIYHITWSLNPTVYKPKDSNGLIESKKFTPIVPIVIATTPSIFK